MLPTPVIAGAISSQSNRHLTDDQLALVDIGIAHHFGGGTYIKETRIPAGAYLAQHAHAHDHLSYLVEGEVVVWVDGESCTVQAPSCLNIAAGKVHAVRANTAALWLCIWATECTDPNTVDAHIDGAIS